VKNVWSPIRFGGVKTETKGKATETWTNYEQLQWQEVKFCYLFRLPGVLLPFVSEQEGEWWRGLKAAQTLFPLRLSSRKQFQEWQLKYCVAFIIERGGESSAGILSSHNSQYAASARKYDFVWARMPGSSVKHCDEEAATQDVETFNNPQSPESVGESLSRAKPKFSCFLIHSPPPTSSRSPLTKTIFR
jgi:hypothetical protein